jgi:hypothetical protein
MYYVFIYENRRMNTVELILRKREGMRENDGGGESKIFCKHICNITIYTLIQLLYANIKILNTLNKKNTWAKWSQCCILYEPGIILLEKICYLIKDTR